MAKKSKPASYRISKYFIEKSLHVYMNNSLGETVEFTKFKDASRFCELLNANTDSNCRYEIHVIG